MRAPRTPPKVPRPEPAPLAQSPAVAELTPAVRAAASPARVDDLVARFWNEVPQTPLIEPAHDGERIVTFLWRDARAAEVLLFANRLTDERRIDDSLLHRVPGTDVWSLSYRMASDWRASYSFLVRQPGERAPWTTDDDQVALRAALDRGVSDPRNPATVLNRTGVEQSVVALPDAPPQRWLERRDGVARGTVASVTGPDGRALWVYDPPGVAGDLPIVIVLDGEVWRRWLPTTFDNLLADGQVRPARLVLVDSGTREQRWRELDGSGDAVTWLADRLVPWVREQARDAAGSAAAPAVTVAGQSLGGFTALRAVLERPEVFAAALAQSASTWAGDLAALAGDTDRRGTRVWLEVGTQEWVLREAHGEVSRALSAAGADVTFREFNGGHDYACWRGGIADGLRALLAVE